MKKFWIAFRPVCICFLIMTGLCGVIYPGIVTGIAQAAFPAQANGSLLKVTLKDGTKKTYGSSLLQQEFTKPQYLIGRPLGVTNLSPVGEEEKKKIQERVDWWHWLDPANTAEIPADLVTASGSGVDPNISPAAAEYQVARIARVRGITEQTVRAAIARFTTGRLLGFWGERAVNVLKVNLALDGLI
jgi:K+-transporting ATPase ATPase C chain